ncbi:MAG: DsbA family protein [Deltaproteobacteria bacterium]|nr:DsbA family protein [Deltaproteobacteria bacterium]
MSDDPRPRLRLIVYSDYLCPWCYNAAVRLERVRDEQAGAVELDWRSYLLRPHPDARRTLEKFRAYTQSWQRPAADPDGGTFRVWATDAGPPSHSLPPHLVAKAAARLGPEAFERMHAALLYAYFAANRDITDAATLRAIWDEVGLPPEALAAADDPAIAREVIDQHNQAVELGLTGVPAVMVAGSDVPVPGAQPLETYRRWVKKLLAEQG